MIGSWVHQFVIRATALLAAAALLTSPRALGGEDEPERPVIDGPWVQIAGDPDLGPYTRPGQQPVDFGIWQAADGTWQLWSCIRNTGCGGKTRLFYRWEGDSLTEPDWTPMGVAMEADPAFGETPGGLQAPHVIRHDGGFLMLYGSWGAISLARSTDGKTFERVDVRDGRPQLFSGPYRNTRDAMVLRIDDTFHCYYTGHTPDESARFDCAVFCRTSTNLLDWSDATIVAAGGETDSLSDWYGGSCECPFVVRRGDWYYLFRNQVYGRDALNTQYASRDPRDFGVDEESKRIGRLPVAAPEIVRHDGRDYIASLMPDLKGIRIAPLRWEPASEGSGDVAEFDGQADLPWSPDGNRRDDVR